MVQEESSLDYEEDQSDEDYLSRKRSKKPTLLPATGNPTSRKTLSTLRPRSKRIKKPSSTQSKSAPFGSLSVTNKQKAKKDSHKDADDFTCEKCGESFGSGWALGGHASRVHPGESKAYKRKI